MYKLSTSREIINKSSKQSWVYLRIAEGIYGGHRQIQRTKKRGLTLLGRGGSARGGFDQKSFGREQVFKSMMTSYWLSCWWVRMKIILDLSGECKRHSFLLWFAKIGEVKHESFPNKASQFYFKWGSFHKI